MQRQQQKEGFREHRSDRECLNIVCCDVETGEEKKEKRNKIKLQAVNGSHEHVDLLYEHGRLHF